LGYAHKKLEFPVRLGSKYKMNIRETFTKFVKAFESSEFVFGGEYMNRIGVRYRRTVDRDVLARWVEKDVAIQQFEFITMVSRLVYEDDILFLHVELAGSFAGFERIAVFVNEQGESEATIGLDTDFESPMQVVKDLLIFAQSIKSAPTFPHRYVLRSFS
jgi:hypothetical protein